MSAKKHGMAKKQDKTLRPRQQPEALATFAAAARHGGKKPSDVGLVATPATEPLPGNLEAEQGAAAAILNENATGRDHGGKDAADALPDRTRTVNS